jgi:rhomboid protease GluP
VLFIVLLIFNYTKPQNDYTWNCSLYQLQNKFFPKLRYSFEFWRVPISGFFHSNIAHFCLNVFGLQMYGYFVEWYYGKWKLVLSLILTVVLSHFFAAAVDNLSISTMASSLLYCVIALKIWFLFEYRNYKPLEFRRIMICLLLGLITAINLIPIFVVNNVDFTSHLGGLLVGGLMGTFFHLRKEE